MKIGFKSSFYRSFDKYSSNEQERIYSSIGHIIQSIEKNQFGKGLGMKPLRSKSRVWEARVSSDIRIIFRKLDEILEFGIVGNHDEIKRYLKNL